MAIVLHAAVIERKLTASWDVGVMGIENLNKAAQAAGLAMVTADDEIDIKQPARPADAWHYTGPRTIKSDSAAKPASTDTSAASVWSYLTGKATA